LIAFLALACTNFGATARGQAREQTTRWLALARFRDQVIGRYVEPRVSGNVLAVSPSVVLFAVFFWTFL
jgi:hypothetical protein